MEISKLRKKVDDIDKKLIENLSDRARFAQLIGKYKRKNNISLHDVNRETQILERLHSLNHGPLTNEDISSIFREIFSACLALQKHIKIVYLGPEATNTHLAAVKYFGKAYEYIPVKTINDVFTEVEKGAADFGVVPIENSTEGVVSYTLDVFMDSDLKIYAEIFMDIDNNLISKNSSISDIKKLYSHPQPLGQCRRWIENNLANVRIIEVDSTSKAAELASKEKGAAAIGSDLAAKKYNLKILADHIQDIAQNTTRFFVISKNMSTKTKRNKTSILFSIKDRIGALYDMLTPFREAGINLTKIESRPTKKRAWEYVFFVDFIGHKDEEKVIKALEKLQKQCLFLKVLGSYTIGS